MKISKKLILLMTSAVLACSFDTPALAETVDLRQYAHGISYVENPVSHKSCLIWSDAYKKGVDRDGSWTHDVYRMTLNPNKPKLHSAKRIIKADEAQEPASASCTDDGMMIVTFEDGNDAGDYELAQRYAIYDKRMKAVKKYPATIAMGGHSGHAASTAKNHLVFWSEGWIDGGGVDDLGSGDDLYLTAMDSKGDNAKTIDVAVSDKTRDWWPMIAASESRALLVWQRYLDDKDYAQLCTAMYDPASGDLKTMSVNEKAHYYNYNAVYLKNLHLFAVNVTTVDKDGVLLLINENGQTVRRIDKCKAFVREASPAIKYTDDGVKLYYPVCNSDVECISIKNNLTAKSRILSGNYDWPECGVAGFTDNKGNPWFAALDVKKFKKHKKTVKLISFTD